MPADNTIQLVIQVHADKANASIKSVNSPSTWPPPARSTRSLRSRYAGTVPIIHQAVAVKAAIDALDAGFQEDRPAKF